VQAHDDGVGLIIFDADNTLRRTTVPGQVCPRDPKEWELLPGVVERLHAIAWGPGAMQLGVASNQDQIAYGFVSEATAHALLRDMAREATGYAPPAGAVQLCPHTIESACGCRKPQPGLLHRIMRFYTVPPDRTLFVGDHAVDADAARRAGVQFQWAQDFFGWGRP